MLSAGAWQANQANTIIFVLVDASGIEVTGLGSAFVLEISKAGAAFQASAGTKGEIGSGWYSYASIAGEADTVGPIAIKITGAGIVQQNLLFVVETWVVGTVEYTYTLTSTVGGAPIANANVSFSTNSNPANTVWSGITDNFGVARDLYGNLPRLSPGVYTIFSSRPGFVFQPDIETIS